jgi:lipopolysaccharide transport system permease protein
MLGIGWIVLQPLAMILIYTVIFSQVMKAKLHGADGSYTYSIYLCSGIITWGLFAEIIQRSQSIFIDNANLLKKVSFPRLTLPIIVVATALLNFSIVFGLFLIFLVMTGNMPGLAVFSIFPLLLVEVIFAGSLGLAIGIFNVFFRDTGQISGLLLQIWFWATPIAYPASILPESLRPWMAMNPMYHLVSSYQDIFVSNKAIIFEDVSLPAALATVLAFFTIVLYRRHAGDIVDEL